MAKTQVAADSGSPQIIITREFDAPRDLLFRAYTEPGLLARWLGPREMTMTVDRLDVRDGGLWRYVHTDPDGTEHGFHGVFHGTPSPDAIVQTFEYEGWPGRVSLDTLTLEERDGRTFTRSVTSFQSVAVRDAMVESGMEHGVRDSDERLDQLLADLLAG